MHRRLLGFALALAACGPTDPGTGGDPTPAETPEPGACPDGQEGFWDSALAACVPVACGAGPFPEAPADDSPRVYVDPSFDGAANGSLTNPWPSLEVAFGQLPEGATVLLAAGEHWLQAPLDVPFSDMRIRGRCPDLTILHAASRGVRVGQKGSVVVERLTIEGPGGHIVDSSLVECFNAPLFTLEKVVLRDPAWHGVSLFQCGDATLRHVTVQGAGRHGVESAFGTNLVLDEIAVFDTRHDPDGEGGWGVFASGGDSLMLSGHVAGNAGGGVHVTQTEGVTLRNLLIADNGGPGVRFHQTGAAWLMDSEVARNTGFGVWLGYIEGGVTGVSVHDTAPWADGTGGQGLFATNSADVVIRSNGFADNREVGIGLTLTTGDVELNTVDGTRANDQGVGGRCIELGVVDDVDVVQNTLTGCEEAGVALLDGRAFIRENEIVDVGVGVRDGYPWGHGIHVQVGGAVELTDNTITGALHSGMHLIQGADAVITGNAVSGTRAGELGGDGLVLVGVGGEPVVSGNSWHDNARAGLLLDSTTLRTEANAGSGNAYAVIVQNGAQLTSVGDDFTDNDRDAPLEVAGREHDLSDAFMPNLVDTTGLDN